MPCVATLIRTACSERSDAAGDANERTCFRRSCARRRARSRGRRRIRSVGWECRQHPDGLAPDDAQSSWPDVVAAANAQFKAQNPGWDVNVQYQEWGYAPAKFDATLAGGNAPDVIEMGNTEMTKYMAAGAFQDLSGLSFPNQSTWLAGLAASGRYGGKLYGVPYYAGSRVVTYRTDIFKQMNAKIPTSLAEFTALARKIGAKNTDTSFSPVYIAGTDWYVAMSFVYDYGGKIAITRKGKWVGTLDKPAALAGLAAYKRFFDAASRASKTTDEAHPNPWDVYRPGQRRVDVRSSVVQLLRRRLQEPRRAVRDAEPHEGPADPGLPRRLRSRGSDRRQPDGRARPGSAPSRTTPR